MARILITDDEEAMRAIMATTLQMRGHEVVQAKTAREAIEKHQERRADVIITDLVMKEMDGTELLRRVRAFSSTPVIAVSGNKHSTIYLNMAKLIGAERVLAKPFPPDALVQAVDEVLAQGQDAKRTGTDS